MYNNRCKIFAWEGKIMYLHEKVCVSQIRAYSSAEGYENKEPFDLILTVHHLGDDKVFVEGMRGVMSKALLRALTEYARERGVREILFQRGKNDRVIKVC